ncbi:DUF4167 domain-containing protein [Mesorhizobium sp. M9A.F.Ca.ET.002.03.1.2]|uniref:DUF4167 domain-containing protein n=1 Tax=Mesorhizobium sp. M9A.F.Ca.ET.002.03.1.2 TaxID=2493668 RepID=UPI001FDFBE3C|nr:DUF4167 domain-containing protein [Mesorhizobium sp. M9A.F.Ca.ET.002.03.1.2]
MRGRNNSGGGNNNNRKGPNPLTRNYESNGPDVKIRGSAQQIAEKYATLARDAQSSGDRVMAENYLQHAEHYNRIIAAAQAQIPIQNAQQNRDDFDDDGDDDRDQFDNTGNSNVGEAATPVVNHGAGPQPVIDGTPAELAFNQENGRDNGGRDSNGRDNNGGRHRDRRPNGGYGQNGQRSEYGARGEQRGGQNQRSETPVQNETPVQAEAVSAAEPALPLEDFSPAGLAAQAEMKEAAAESGAARRPRRPRRPRVNAERGADQVDGGNDNAGADKVDAAPAEDAGGEPAIVDVNN